MIPTTPRRSPVYTGTGALASYAFAFKVFAAADIAVKVVGTNGVETTWTLGAQYTVTLNADQDAYPGGVVTPTAPLSSGSTLTVIGAQAYTQTTQIPTGGAFNASIFERAFDRTVIMVQQLAERADRAVSAPAGEVLATMPPATTRAGRYLGFDAAGNPIALTNGNTLLDGVVLDPVMFGAVGDGVTDDTAKLQDGIDYLYARGGGRISSRKRFRIAGNLTIKPGVSLVGAWVMPGELTPAASAAYGALHSVLFISPSASITLQGSASVQGWVVMRDGLSLPFANATAAAAGVAAFTGTPFVVGGQDVYFGHLLVLGFNKAIASNGYERVRCEYVSGDCTNGIEIESCADVAYLDKCHFWPFTTVHQSWTTNALLRRSGTAYRLANLNDWGKASDCFAYGYYRGFYVENANSVTLLGCSADNTSTAGVGDHAGAIGFYVGGTANDTRLVACQSAAQSTSYHVNTDAGNHTRLMGCDGWAAAGVGCVVNLGDVSIVGGNLRDLPRGVVVNNGASRVRVAHVRFRGISVAPISLSVATPNVRITELDFGDFTGNPIENPANFGWTPVASAATVLLENTGEFHVVTGTTNITTLNHGWLGRRVTLKFAGVLTVVDGGNLSLAGNFVTSTNATLTLIFDGTTWNEVARSVN